MKFKVIRSKFLDGLKSVQNIVAGKGSLPILQNVMIEAGERSIKLTTTDLDISIKAEVECEVSEAGATTLPVKLLFVSMTKAAEGEIEVEVDPQERASIRAGSARFKLQGMSASEFPQLPEEGDAFSYTVTQATIKEMLRKTSYAASQDDTRRMLKGVLMSFKDEKLTFKALHDSYFKCRKGTGISKGFRARHRTSFEGGCRASAFPRKRRRRDDHGQEEPDMLQPLRGNHILEADGRYISELQAGNSRFLL